jgi:hypothetical protein
MSRSPITVARLSPENAAHNCNMASQSESFLEVKMFSWCDNVTPGIIHLKHP